MRNFFQTLLLKIEGGESQLAIRLIPLFVALLLIGGLYDFGPFSTVTGQIGGIYHGLSDPQSMDNAQVARQIVRGEGFTTKFLRPYAVMQLHDYTGNQSLLGGKAGELFPAARFPAGTQRILPDTYNAPGYPYLLAAWFYLVRPQFDPTVNELGQTHFYSGDRWIPLLNQGFMLLTAWLVFAMGYRLFDSRVAWMSLVAFLCTDLIWRYSVTALSTGVLMFVVTALLLCVLEIFSIGEACAESGERSFGLAWLWALLAGLLMAVACLMRLQILGLLLPLLAMFFLMPRINYLIPVLIAVMVALGVAPWFWHMDTISGSPLGSNTPMLLYGVDDSYKGNQVYCSTSIPTYERLFKDLSKKEYLGFRWHFEHAWSLLGSSPLIVLFAAAVLHRFKRLRAQVFLWLLVAATLALIAVNNLSDAVPEALGGTNTVMILFPAMIVVGSAYFFIMLDRLNLQIWIFNNLIIGAVLFLTALPLLLTITTTSNQYYSFPPYMPPVIKLVTDLNQPEEWITSDMPWATAWYGDHASLWLPDSVADFENIHDNICPSGILLFTPVTWGQPVANVLDGEQKDWFPFISLVNLPASFPLKQHTATPPGGPEYSIWSDRARWRAQ